MGTGYNSHRYEHFCWEVKMNEDEKGHWYFLFGYN
jgi:hypothetical protein